MSVFYSAVKCNPNIGQVISAYFAFVFNTVLKLDLLRAYHKCKDKHFLTIALNRDSISFLVHVCILVRASETTGPVLIRFHCLEADG